MERLIKQLNNLGIIDFVPRSSRISDKEFRRFLEYLNENDYFTEINLESTNFCSKRILQVIDILKNKQKLQKISIYFYTSYIYPKLTYSNMEGINKLTALNNIKINFVIYSPYIINQNDNIKSLINNNDVNKFKFTNFITTKDVNEYNTELINVINNYNVYNLHLTPNIIITNDILNTIKTNDTIFKLNIPLPNNFDNMFLKENNSIQIASFNNINSYNYNLLVDGLKNNFNIKHLKLNFNKNEVHKELNVFNDLLQFNTSIIKVLLENYCIQNSQFLKNNTLKILVINNCYNLNYTKINIDDLIYSLENNNSLETFKIYNTFFKNENIDMLLYRVLSTNTTLTNLNINNCNLKKIDKLSESLKVNTSLTKLNLANNNILDINNLAESLLINTSLTQLNLNSTGLKPLFMSKNNVKLVDIDKLSEVLQVNTSLLKLKLNHRRLTSNYLKYIISIIQNNNYLNELSILFSNIEEFKVLCDALKYNKSLYKIKFCCINDITSEIRTEINKLLLEVLQYNKTLIDIKFY